MPLVTFKQVWTEDESDYSLVIYFDGVEVDRLGSLDRPDVEVLYDDHSDSWFTPGFCSRMVFLRSLVFFESESADLAGLETGYDLKCVQHVAVVDVPERELYYAVDFDLDYPPEADKLDEKDVVPLDPPDPLTGITRLRV